MSDILLILLTKCVVILFTLKQRHDIICVLPFSVISQLLGSPRMLKSNTSPNKHPALTFSLEWQPRVLRHTHWKPIRVDNFSPWPLHSPSPKASVFIFSWIRLLLLMPTSKQRSLLAYSPGIAVQLVSLSQLVVPTPVILQGAASERLKTWMGPGCPTVG